MRRKIVCLCLSILTMVGAMGCSKIINSNNVSDVNISYPPTVHPTEPTKVKDNKSDKYQQAIDYINEKHYPQAIGILQDLGDYKSSKSLLKQLRYIISDCYISNGQWAVGAITSTRGVAVACDYKFAYRYSAVKSWRDIKAICFRSGDSIEGLTYEGKIITTSDVTEKDLLSSSVVSNYACAQVVGAVTSWKDIEYYQDHYPQSAIALTKDGSVYSAYSSTEGSNGYCPLTGWNDIIAIADGGCYIAGLKSDGTVVVNNYGCSSKLNVSDWKDIVAISAGASLFGLKKDGTVVSTDYVYDLSSWTDIISISADNYNSILGLKSDGTVVATGNGDYFGKLKVSTWSDIVAIDIGCYFSIGLKADGTMVLTGDCSKSGADTPDITSMKDLFIPQIDLN